MGLAIESLVKYKQKRSNKYHLVTPQITIRAAVQWLHASDIIHPDIRCKNIVLHNGGAILASYLHWSLPTPYCGGHICIPPENLEGIIVKGWQYEYYPALSDDCFAIVLLVYMLLSPNRFAGFRPSMISEPGLSEGPWLVNFWRELSESKLWGGCMTRKTRRGGKPVFDRDLLLVRLV